MLLNENKLYKNIRDIEEGDWITIKYTQVTNIHMIVEKNTGKELLLKQNSGHKFLLYPETAIDEDTITLYSYPTKKGEPKPFISVIVSDKNRELKFKITPEASDELDTDVQDKIIKDVKANRDEIMDRIRELEEGSVFDIYAGDTNYDEEGEAIIKNGTESRVRLQVEEINLQLYTCSIVKGSLEGKYKELFSKYVDEKFHIHLGSKLFNTTYNTGVAVQVFHGDSKKPIIYKDVYLLEIIEETEDEDKKGESEVDEPRTLEDLLQDKDLMRLMKHKTVWDKVLGRKAKGIKPIENLKNKEPLNKFFSSDKRKGQRVSFIYHGPAVVGEKVSLKKGNTYHGYMRTDDQIKITGGKNSKESIILTLGDMVDNMYRKVAISHKKSDGSFDRTKRGYAKIL